MTAPTHPPSLPRGIDPSLTRQIRQASAASGSDFGLLMAQAAQESGFRPDAKSTSSSATGLYQFIDSTWLDMMQRFGAKYGMGALAEKIGTNVAGKPHVADPATRQRILGLRSDPTLSTALAGEYAKLNKDEVERALGRPVGRAEIYMAHFLGAGGATTFLRALATRGATPAAQLLPEAAASNRGIFFDSDTGRAKSVAEIYRTLGTRIEQEAQAFAGSSTVADAGPGLPDVANPGPASLTHRLDFAGLQLSPPVASMLDTLTLAALKLTGATPAHPRRTDRPS